VDVPSRELGVPQQFLEHGSRDQVLRELGLTAQDVALRIIGWVARFDDARDAGRIDEGRIDAGPGDASDVLPSDADYAP
jgi:1-deoxy-D-xylulose-5-phosphate synthase